MRRDTHLNADRVPKLEQPSRGNVPPHYDLVAGVCTIHVMTARQAMRRCIVAALVTLATVCGCAGALDRLFPGANAKPVAPGDRITREQLIQRLGPPRSEIGLGGVSYLRFDSAAVALQDRRVLKAWRDSRTGRVYNLTVDAMKTAHRAGPVFVAAVSPMARESLEFRDACQYLWPVLSELGYEPTDDQELAQYVVSVGFGIASSSTLTETSYRPVFSYAPGEQAQFTATCIGCETVHGTLSTQGKVQTSYVPESRKRVSHMRFLDLRAVDAQDVREGRTPREAWTVRVQSSGPSDDLRLVLPVMVAAAWTRIGSQTEHQEAVRYADSTLRVRAVREAAQGMAKP